ncbi:MAG: dUTP diphosphatase [Candidatus Doudnabacteria bacterium CG10_big_fil_rev_8_21_14_0_10_41_10]|uniref:dUTP diphosphatase n=1 Tax=Candidatus Doudnabacteria bacterium CG10_big_fil_rev_8_21_14_0_10_41_10 TaxID=1974551 RepID=A0A2H0VC62_9BACT|nr:MAG: dUTP diphosphatase [Candidatus Doudnabacteria bacterium CG10_big_fil_rev_8_21_14_0_10_41_10]
MKVKIFRIDKSLPLPEYKTKGSVAFDIYSRVDATVSPKAIETFPTNLIVKVPVGYILMIVARSSTGKKKGLSMANGVGVIDQDFHGSEDEIKILFRNFTDQKVIVKKGERIAQGLILPIEKAEWEEVEEMTGKSRGGFGSTG